MKAAYFDTSVYNRILDHPKCGLITKMLVDSFTSGQIEILFSINNFEEFCHTGNVGRRTKLFQLAYSVCSSHKFTLSHEDLIKKEFKGNGPVKTIYSTFDFEDKFQKAIKGTLFQRISDKPLEEMKKRKRCFQKFEKNIKQKLAPHWQAYKNISFDAFYHDCLQNNEARAMLKDICVRAIGNSRRCNQDLLASNLQNLPGLCCLFKYECASLYKQLLRNGKCTWGSGIDMTHSVFIGYCDIFLTEDRGFMDIVRLFNRSNLECLSLDEFVSSYGTN
jgi:hypothetical protein